MKIHNGFRLGRIEDYDHIICLDYGHGNCTATQVIKSKVVRDLASDEISNKKYRRELIEKLSLDPKYPEIPSAILYDKDEVRIGVQAAGKKGCRLYFKVCPDQFEKEYQGVTYGKLTFDFIRELMNNIRRKNNISPGARILLLIGCPTHRDWLKRDNLNLYEQLIKKASGASQVIVLQESRAAIVNAYNAQDEENVWITKGILVVDFGSSTTDCTWLKTGEKPFEFSWRLGAHEIEEGMLELALRRKGLTEADLSVDDKETFLWIFRRRKEMYYNGEAVDPVNIHIYELDSEGKPVIKADGRRKELLQFEVDIDDGFMQEVTNNRTFKVKKDQDEWEEDSYVNHCKKLFMTARNLLEKHECKTIVLTGGASRMGFIWKICREVFSRENGYPDIVFPNGGDPSFSVSMGLAYAVLQDLDAEHKLGAVQKEVREKIDEIINTYMDVSAEAVFNVYEKAIGLELNAWKNSSSDADKSINSLVNVVNRTLTDGRLRPEINSAILSCHADMVKKCGQVIQQCINENFSRLYHNILPEKSYQLSKEQWNKILSAFDLTSFVNAKTLVGDGQGFGETILRVTIACALLAVSRVLALAGQPVRLLYNLFCGTGDEISNSEWNNIYYEMFRINEVANGDLSKPLNDKKRERIVQEIGEKLPGELKPKIRQSISDSIEEAKRSGKVQLDQMVMDELGEAVELIAFYS